jgi:hypothetical protein
MTTDTDTRTRPETGRAGQVRWRRRILFGALAAGALLVALHAFGGPRTGMGAVVIGGLALLGFVIWRLPQIRRHFRRPGNGDGGEGGRGPGSLNFPSQVAARQRRRGLRGLMSRHFGGSPRLGGGSRSGGGPRLGGGSRSGRSLFRHGTGGRRGAAFRAGGTGTSFRGRAGIFRHGRHGGGGSRRSGWGGGPRSGGSRGISGRRRSPVTTGGRRGQGPSGSRRRGFAPWRRNRPVTTGGRNRPVTTGGRVSPSGTGSRRPSRWHPVRRSRWNRQQPVSTGGTQGQGPKGKQGGTQGQGPKGKQGGKQSNGQGLNPGGTQGQGPKGKQGGKQSNGQGLNPGGAGNAPWPVPRRPSWRHPVRRSRWRRAQWRQQQGQGKGPLNPGYRRWYAPWRRSTGPAALVAGAGPGRMRRGLHRVIGTPHQRHVNRLARISRRARVRAFRKRNAASPYTGTGRWASLRSRFRAPRHPRTGRKLGWRARIVRRRDISRRGMHKGLGTARPSLRSGRPPRPLFAGARNSPGLHRFRNSRLGRGITWIDRRRQDRWLRRQRRYAPAAVRRPHAPRPGIRLGHPSPYAIPLNGLNPRAGGGTDTRAIADQIRVHGGHQFTDAQDIHDSLTGMHELVSAAEDVLAGWWQSLAGTGLHPAYAEAMRKAAGHIAGIADQLEGVTSGGVMRGPGS